ncbi:MAG: hypothetical protein Q9177_002748 [Variospora cf. flavescens]
MSFIARRGLSTLIPPKIASPSGIGAAQDAARMERVVSFYEKLPRGPAPEVQPRGLFERYQARYFGKRPSAAPLAHFIGVMLVFGYSQHYYFHFNTMIGATYETQMYISGESNSRNAIENSIAAYRQTNSAASGLRYAHICPKAQVHHKILSTSSPFQIDHRLLPAPAPSPFFPQHISMLKHIIALAALLTLATCAPRRNLTYTPTCYPPEQPLIRPAIFSECWDIIREIPTSSTFDPGIPLKFSPDPARRPDIRLPAAWTFGKENCDVGLQFNPGASGDDRTSLYDVQSAAKAVAIQCVIKPPHLGGVMVVGWKNLMAVNVLNLAQSLRRLGAERNESVMVA